MSGEYWLLLDREDKANLEYQLAHLANRSDSDENYYSLGIKHKKHETWVNIRISGVKVIVDFNATNVNFAIMISEEIQKRYLVRRAGSQMCGWYRDRAKEVLPKLSFSTESLRAIFGFIARKISLNLVAGLHDFASRRKYWGKVCNKIFSWKAGYTGTRGLWKV